MALRRCLSRFAQRRPAQTVVVSAPSCRILLACDVMPCAVTLSPPLVTGSSTSWLPRAPRRVTLWSNPTRTFSGNADPAPDADHSSNNTAGAEAKKAPPLTAAMLKSELEFLRRHLKQFLLKVHPDFFQNSTLQQANTESLASLNALLDYCETLANSLGVARTDQGVGRPTLPDNLALKFHFQKDNKLTHCSARVRLPDDRPSACGQLHGRNIQRYIYRRVLYLFDKTSINTPKGVADSLRQRWALEEDVEEMQFAVRQMQGRSEALGQQGIDTELAERLRGMGYGSIVDKDGRVDPRMFRPRTPEQKIGDELRRMGLLGVPNLPKVLWERQFAMAPDKERVFHLLVTQKRLKSNQFVPEAMIAASVVQLREFLLDEFDQLNGPKWLSPHFKVYVSAKFSLGDEYMEIPAGGFSFRELKETTERYVEKREAELGEPLGPTDRAVTFYQGRKWGPSEYYNKEAREAAEQEQKVRAEADEVKRKHVDRWKAAQRHKEEMEHRMAEDVLRAAEIRRQSARHIGLPNHLRPRKTGTKP